MEKAFIVQFCQWGDSAFWCLRKVQIWCFTSVEDRNSTSSLVSTAVWLVILVEAIYTRSLEKALQNNCGVDTDVRMRMLAATCHPTCQIKDKAKTYIFSTECCASDRRPCACPEKQEHQRTMNENVLLAAPYAIRIVPCERQHQGVLQRCKWHVL